MLLHLHNTLIWVCWGMTTIWLLSYDHSKNRLVECDVQCRKKFKYIFFIINNWFWNGITQLHSPKNNIRAKTMGSSRGVSLRGKDCWGDYNSTLHNHSKNRPAGDDVEYYKRFEFIFPIINGFHQWVLR